jgi:hypothetical protein
VSHGDRASDLVLIHDGRIEYAEGEADYTVRPIPPERMAQAIAERDLIQKCLAEQKAKRESPDH